MPNMRTIYPSENPRRNPKLRPAESRIRKPARWYSTEYLAAVWAKRPAKILAVLAFVATATILILVFAAGSESNTLNLGAGTKVGVNVSPTDGKVRLNTASTASLKAPVLGIIDESNIANTTYVHTVNVSIVNIDWSVLQPNSTNDAIPRPANPCATGGLSNSSPNVDHNPGGFINPIDCRLKNIRDHNTADPTHPVSLKIRIFAGGNAPGWAKSIGGAPFSYTDPTDHRTTTIGRFWSPTYRTDYAALQTKLAAEYDTVPELRDITIAGCMTLYAEPFIRGIGGSSADAVRDRAAYVNAGYTQQADKDCHHDQIVAHQVWTHTRSSLSFNPFQTIDANGNFLQDEPFTESMMDLCRNPTIGLGNRCVLENNSIRWPALSGYASMYSHMANLGAPITFQTSTSPRMDNRPQCQSIQNQFPQNPAQWFPANGTGCTTTAWQPTLAWAITQHATAVEAVGDYNNPLAQSFPGNVWPGWNLTALTNYDTQLEANPYQ